MEGIFNFGETVKGYPVKVLNEREIRAGAGILFAFAMVAFMHAWLVGDYSPVRLFVVLFLSDFLIRLAVNPRYSPSLILGRLAVSGQEPEYTAAEPKRFAWSIGLALSIAMLYLVVINNLVGPVNLLICLSCLAFLFLESAFGVCVGCKVFSFLTGKAPVLCPGGACKPRQKGKIQEIGALQIVVLLFFLSIAALAPSIMGAHVQETAGKAPAPAPNVTAAAANGTGCTVPEWAVAIGHEEMWKMHNNCK